MLYDDATPLKLGYLLFDEPRSVVVVTENLDIEKYENVSLAVPVYEGDVFLVSWEDDGVHLRYSSPKAYYAMLVMGAKIRGKLSIPDIAQYTIKRTLDIPVQVPEKIGVVAIVPRGILLSVGKNKLNIEVEGTDFAKLLGALTLPDIGMKLAKNLEGSIPEWKPLTLQEAIAILETREPSPKDLGYVEALASLLRRVVGGLYDSLVCKNENVYLDGVSLDRILRLFRVIDAHSIFTEVFSEVSDYRRLARCAGLDDVVKELKDAGITDHHDWQTGVTWSIADDITYSIPELLTTRVLHEYVSTGKITVLRKYMLAKALKAHLIDLNVTPESGEYMLVSIDNKEITASALAQILLLIREGCETLRPFLLRCHSAAIKKVVAEVHAKEPEQLAKTLESEEVAKEAVKVIAQYIVPSKEAGDEVAKLLERIYDIIESGSQGLDIRVKISAETLRELAEYIWRLRSIDLASMPAEIRWALKVLETITQPVTVNNDIGGT